MKQPKVSVIVPVYNVQECLPKCIDSLLGQDFEGIEIVLINDGATDSSGAICDTYAHKYSNIRVIHQKNAGVSAARNTGLKNVTAPYVFFLDSDDFIAHDMISRLYVHMTEKNCDIAMGEMKEWRSPNDIRELKKRFDKETVLLDDDIISTFLSSRLGFSNVCSCMFRTEMLAGVSFNTNISIGEDAVFLWEILKKSKCVVVDPLAIYYYYMRPGSAVNSGFNAKHVNIMEWNVNLPKEIKLLHPKHFNAALMKAVHGHITILNLIALSVSVEKKYIEQILSTLRPMIKEYWRIANNNMLRRSLVVLCAYAFPIYRIIYRTYMSIKMRGLIKPNE